MRDFTRWSKAVSVVGGVGLVVGSLDPLEGSALILPGSALLALGGYFAHEDRRIITYRTASFILIALGVAALFWTSQSGGFGGNSGRSMWWGLLIVPYLVGWSLVLWGPGAKRWISIAGMAIGVWYVLIFVMMLRSAGNRVRPVSIVPAMILGVIGVGTMIACSLRLRNDTHGVP